MPVPTLITSLSTTAASNSPDGSESVITTDDYVRAHAAFIAQLRDGAAFTGTVAAPTAVRVNGATQGLVGTRFGGGSGGTANGTFDDMVIDVAASGGLSIMTGTSGVGGILVGDSASNFAGGWRYSNATDESSIWAAGASRVTVTATGDMLLTSPAGGIGYGVGAGSSVTQLTSKATAVTINRPCGRIITSSSNITAGSFARFVVNNSTVTANDVVHVCIRTVASDTEYDVSVVAVGAGLFVVLIRNMGASTLGEALELNFAVIRGSVT